MQPVITLFCAFTRRWALEIWLENLAGVQHDPALTNLCFIVDCDDQHIARELEKFAKQRGYRSFHVKINEDWHPNQTKLTIRRMRVADIKNQSKDLIAKTDGDIILGFEDDTVFDRLSSFEPLYKPLMDDPAVGYVEGVQMGRWGAQMVGVWDCDDFEYPQKVWTLLPAEGWNGTQEITGGGFYGYATRRELYLQHEYYTSSSQPWGPDVNFGFWVKARGFRCLVDWGVLYGHNDHGIIAYPDNPPRGKLTEIIYNKSNLNGKWERTDTDHDRY